MLARFVQVEFNRVSECPVLILETAVVHISMLTESEKSCRTALATKARSNESRCSLPHLLVPATSSRGTKSPPSSNSQKANDDISHDRSTCCMPKTFEGCPMLHQIKHSLTHLPHDSRNEHYSHLPSTSACWSVV